MPLGDQAVEALYENYVKLLFCEQSEDFVEVFEFPTGSFDDVDFLWGDGNDYFAACLSVTPGIGAFAVYGEVFVMDVFYGADAVALLREAVYEVFEGGCFS
ncbi:MAG: hypothetical protein M1540_07415 [Candidatus Bathyarchaeota archaeon]|nr:hypothetical protein [Candidatus Bathyarchaeota archaeon]